MATARHPKATLFVQRQLFAGLTSFAELESRISALPEEKTRGDAFEQFVKAFLLLEGVPKVFAKGSTDSGYANTSGVLCWRD